VRWTDADNAWLREHYASSTVQALQARFPHWSYYAIRKQAESLGLKRRQRGIPKPQGTVWSEAENAVLRAYAAGQVSHATVCAQLPGRTWDAIEHHARVLGLGFRRKPVFYEVVHDEREIIDQEDPSRRVW
jgi:hypothetical protein